MSNPMSDTRTQLGWVRRASAVAMTRGNHRPRLFGGTVIEDVRMDGVDLPRRPRGLWRLCQS